MDFSHFKRPSTLISIESFSASPLSEDDEDSIFEFERRKQNAATAAHQPMATRQLEQMGGQEMGGSSLLNLFESGLEEAG